MKRYRLKIDFYYLYQYHKDGIVFLQNNNLYYQEGNIYNIDSLIVENNPDIFEEIKENNKFLKKIERLDTHRMVTNSEVEDAIKNKINEIIDYINNEDKEE